MSEGCDQRNLRVQLNYNENLHQGNLLTIAKYEIIIKEIKGF
jgi:hypothetical protein